MSGRAFPRLAVALALSAGVPASAAHAEPGDIKGQDVKGDASKSANDGWSQAPVPREESAGKDAPNPGGSSTRLNADRPAPSGSALNGGPDDPSKPMDHRTPGPSGHNPAAPTVK